MRPPFGLLLFPLTHNCIEPAYLSAFMHSLVMLSASKEEPCGRMDREIFWICLSTHINPVKRYPQDDFHPGDCVFYSLFTSASVMICRPAFSSTASVSALFSTLRTTYACRSVRAMNAYRYSILMPASASVRST